MTQRIKVGNVYVEMPGGGPQADFLAPSKPLVAEKPETPEPLDETPYIYRPSDPFQSSIDQAHAVASISTEHKPWVRKTWFVMFIVGPLVWAEFVALAVTLNEGFAEGWRAFLVMNLVIFPVWFIYYSIWRRKARSRKPLAAS